jgi:hypothetical protein
MDTPSPARVWTGRVLSGLAIALLVLDGGMKVLRAAPAVEGTAQLGYPPGTVVPIGLLVLFGVALYAIPRSAVLGAIWLTGFLGGAVATHVRAGSPLPSHTLFPIYVAAVIWLGLVLRKPRVFDVLIRGE